MRAGNNDLQNYPRVNATEWVPFSWVFAMIAQSALLYPTHLYLTCKAEMQCTTALYQHPDIHGYTKGEQHGIPEAYSALQIPVNPFFAPVGIRI